MAVDQKITARDLADWAQRRVNLSSELASKYREQGENMKERLERYIDAHPDFDLVKMLNSGSIAKGIALRSISDMDIGVYVERAAAPAGHADLVGWLRDRLREAYENIIPADRITSDDASVRISYSGTGFDVECVPILYDGDADAYGALLLRTGKSVRTSIPKHLEFVRKRKKEHPTHYAQMLRFMKYWRKVRNEESGATLPGFAMDLIVSHVVDNGTDASNYPQALEDVFSYIVKSNLAERILFTDNYAANKVGESNDPIRIYDPVAYENNVTGDCSSSDRATFVEEAAQALDDISIARTAITKESSLAAWRDVFGPEFNV